MILEVESDGSPVKVEISSSNGVKKISLGGKPIACDWIRLPNGRFSVILDGRVYDLAVELSGERCSVTGRGGTRALRVNDLRKMKSRKEVEEGQAGLQRILAEMPGKVVRVLVKPGESVAHDQGLLVLEAMKMQNEIRAPKSGIVKEVGVEAGKAVNSGEFLLSLE